MKTIDFQQMSRQKGKNISCIRCFLRVETGVVKNFNWGRKGRRMFWISQTGNSLFPSCGKGAKIGRKRQSVSVWQHTWRRWSADQGLHSETGRWWSNRAEPEAEYWERRSDSTCCCYRCRQVACPSAEYRQRQIRLSHLPVLLNAISSPDGTGPERDWQTAFGGAVRSACFAEVWTIFIADHSKVETTTGSQTITNTLHQYIPHCWKLRNQAQKPSGKPKSGKKLHESFPLFTQHL